MERELGLKTLEQKWVSYYKLIKQNEHSTKTRVLNYTTLQTHYMGIQMLPRRLINLVML